MLNQQVKYNTPITNLNSFTPRSSGGLGQVQANKGPVVADELRRLQSDQGVGTVSDSVVSSNNVDIRKIIDTADNIHTLSTLGEGAETGVEAGETLGAVAEAGEGLSLLDALPLLLL